MNVLPYEVKRAHWRMTWTAIRKFRERAHAIRQPILLDMTPARFDFLYVVWRADWQVHEARRARRLDPIPRRINLSELRGLLGLAGATISRMAHQLELLGYVRIVPHRLDKRAVVVVLTEEGENLLRLAVECIRLPGFGMTDRIARFVELERETFARQSTVVPPEPHEHTMATEPSAADHALAGRAFDGTTKRPEPTREQRALAERTLLQAERAHAAAEDEAEPSAENSPELRALADQILDDAERIYDPMAYAARANACARSATGATSSRMGAPVDPPDLGAVPVPPERQRMLDRLATIIDRWRVLARFFGCEAVPIYDTRLVKYLRPHTVTARTWHLPGTDFRSRVLLLNQQLRELEAADARARSATLPAEAR